MLALSPEPATTTSQHVPNLAPALILARQKWDVCDILNLNLWQCLSGTVHGISPSRGKQLRHYVGVKHVHLICRLCGPRQLLCSKCSDRRDCRGQQLSRVASALRPMGRLGSHRCFFHCWKPHFPPNPSHSPWSRSCSCCLFGRAVLDDSWRFWFIAGMVADKHQVDGAKASKIGMLPPTEGITALSRVLGGLESAAPAAAIQGAAAPAYWRALLANVQPVPHLFREVLGGSAQAVQATKVGTPTTSSFYTVLAIFCCLLNSPPLP